MFSQDRWPMTLLHALTKQPTNSSNAIKQQTFAPDISNAVNEHTFAQRHTHTNTPVTQQKIAQRDMHTIVESFACELPRNSFPHRTTWMRANTEQYEILPHVLTRQMANDAAPCTHETTNRH